MSENEKNTLTELTDAELEQASGGRITPPAYWQKCGKCGKNYKVVRGEESTTPCPDCGNYN